MSGSNSHKAAREKMAKTKSKENKRKRQMKHRIAKRPRLRTDINQRVLTNPFRRLSTEKEMSISMVGLDGAGKTTILCKLGENVIETSSRGLNMETVHYKNITFNVWDVGGQHKTRPRWSNYFQGTKGLIFVVDITDRDRVVEARDELHRLLKEDLLKDVVLLVFANKQDVPKRMNEAEITEMLGLSSPIPQLHCRVQITCATSGEGLYEGLDWLSKKIKHTCATSREGVSEGLNWLRNSSANRNYDDMSTGCTFQPTDEELVDFLVQLIDGKDIYPDRVGRVNLFDNHPAVIIRNFSRSHDLLPCMLDTCKYYLFYCKVPDDAICCGLGYHEIQDQAKGVWEPISYSFVFPCTLFDGTERLGEVQKFRYKPVNEATSCWRMDMYGLPDFPRPQPNMVICKVFESAKSKNAVAVRSIASGTREVQDALNRRSTHRAKIKLLEVATREEMTKEDSLEVATREEMTKEDSCQVELGVKVQQLIKMVKKYDRDEHKEADAIDPPNRKRTSCVSAHTSSL